LRADVIDPSIAQLDSKVKQAKRDLVKKPIRSLIGVVGVISFGISTGIVPPDMATIAKAIGLVKFGSNMIEHTMAIGDEEDAIKNNNFYFLWKLRKKAK